MASDGQHTQKRRASLSQKDRLYLVALTAAAPCGGRGFDAQSIQMSLDKRREHVCPITSILVVCLDEEGFKCRTNVG